MTRDSSPVRLAQGYEAGLGMAVSLFRPVPKNHSAVRRLGQKKRLGRAPQMLAALFRCHRRQAFARLDAPATRGRHRIKGLFLRGHGSGRLASLSSSYKSLFTTDDT